MKYHIIYKTQSPSGKYYLGRHSTDDIKDGYQGSGDWVVGHKNKHSLSTTILSYCSSHKELVVAEEKIINEHYDDPMCMNRSRAALGFVSGNHHPNKTKEMRAKISASTDRWKVYECDECGREIKGSGNYNQHKLMHSGNHPNKGRSETERHRKNKSNALKGKSPSPNSHTPEANAKRSRSLKQTFALNNSMSKIFVPISCLECRVVVKGKSNLTQHQRGSRCHRKERKE